MPETDRARLAEIDRDIFDVQMIDRWSDADSARYGRLNNEREKLIAKFAKEAA